MQTEQIVSLLVAERNRLDAAIQALQGSEKRLGRPAGSGRKNAAASATNHNDANVPDSVKPASAKAPTHRKRKAVVWDAAKKKAQGERMRAFWAAKRKKAGKG